MLLKYKSLPLIISHDGCPEEGRGKRRVENFEYKIILQNTRVTKLFPQKH